MSLARKIVRRLRRALKLSPINAVRASDLFDREWYLREYPEVGEAGLDPVLHFMQKGWLEGKQPGPGFDTKWYIASNPDIARRQINPLVHFIEHGRQEGRHPLPPKPILETGRLIDVDLIRVREGSLSCSVALHLHYPDLAEEMLEACLNIPTKFQILVSATSAEAAEAATAWASKTGFQSITVRQTPNRGRNTAAFTTTFAKGLSASDVFCHIHGKKSLYSGEEQKAWRQSGLENLLGSKEHVQRILTLFETRPKLGVAAPLPNPGIPYWAFTWLSNLRTGAELSQKLGVPFSMEGYFDYPLGCMFWARPEALKQLMDGRISLSDYPEETGQTDGTLAHAIERSIYFTSQYNGFSWIELDREQGIFKDGWSERNIHQYRQAKTYSSFVAAIDSAETICFDIFDTLITRLVPRPDDLFDMAEAKLDADLNQKTQFRLHRKAAEQALRLAKSSGDVGYEEIYAELERRKETAGLAKRAYEVEESLEVRATIPRKQVVRGLEYARQRGKRVILASDMYLNRDQVENLLAKSGVGSFDKLYLSSETGLRKDDLSLWRHLTEEEGAQRRSFIHIGDNEHSDVQIPLGLGIRFYHVLSPRNLFDFTPLGHRLRRGAGTHGQKPLSLGPTIATLCNDPFEGRP